MKERESEHALLVHEVLQAVLFDLIDIVENRICLVMDEVLDQQRRDDYPVPPPSAENSADIRAF